MWGRPGVFLIEHPHGTAGRGAAVKFNTTPRISPMKTLEEFENHLRSKSIAELMDELVYLKRDNNYQCEREQSALLRPYLRELGQRLHLNGLEVMVFSIVFKGCSWTGSVAKSELAEHWDKDLAGAGTLHNALERLMVKGLVIPRSSLSSKVSYSIPKDVSKDIYQNRTPAVHTQPMDAYDLANHIIDLIRKIEGNDLELSEGHDMLQASLNRNSGLPFSRHYDSWNLNPEEGLLVAALYAVTVLDEGVLDSERAVSSMIDNKGRAKALLLSLQRKQGPLFAMNIVQHAAEEFQTGAKIEFTEEIASTLFEGQENESLESDRPKTGNLPLIKAASIVKKQLHYNPREQRAVQQLEQSLQQASFLRIRKELGEEGLPQGVTVLLYGAPGTGKTETVLQLARATGRDILKVDISTLRDKYVGESEKQVKRIFDTYREQFRVREVAPILLMNEADGIISNRTREVHQSSDQMHNSMQNIFLEEMENFQGILIATTNFESKLDPAFERRFLHKVKMDPPSVEIRAQIIADRISGISREAALELATKYNLSGGQLDNIARKRLTARLLNGNEPTSEELESYFEAETFTRKKTHAITGFRSMQENSNKDQRY